jgi:hypothetical protein
VLAAAPRQPSGVVSVILAGAPELRWPPHLQAGRVALPALVPLAAEAQPSQALPLLAAALPPQRCLVELCERCRLRFHATQLQERAAEPSRLQGVPLWLAPRERQEQERGRLPEADLIQLSLRLRLLRALQRLRLL